MQTSTTQADNSATPTKIRQNVDLKWFNSVTTPIKPKGKKILLIEDDEQLSLILKDRLVEKYGCKVDVAVDPFEAINDMTESFYDLIILDWNLPALTGGQTLMRMERAMFFEPSLPIQWDEKQVPVVIFSSGSRRDCPFRKSKHFNYAGFVSKAQPLSLIVDVLAEFIEGRVVSA